jgi:hypothetical protein
VTRAPLDVKVLLALLDRDCVDHSTGRDSLSKEICPGLTSCALTD